MLENILIVACASLIVKIFMCLKHSTSFDGYGHLYFVKEIRTQNGGLFKGIKTKNIDGVGEFRHPFFWHYCLSYFPAESLLQWGRCLNPLLDSVFATSIYFFCIGAGFSSEVAFYASLLYIFTPMWFSSLSLGPRVSGVTPRLFSEICTNLFFMTTLLPLNTPFPLRLLLGGGFSFVVLASSKFGLQALLFLTPMIALFSMNILPFVCVLLGLAMVLLFSKGEFLGVMKTQCRHLIWYFKNNKLKKMHVSNRNDSCMLFDWRKGDSLTRNCLRMLYRALIHNSYTGVLLKMPILPLLFVLIIVNWKEALTLWCLLGPVVAATILFLAINHRLLLFLGEAERYLNHVAFFITTSFAVLNEGNAWFLKGLMLYGIAFCFVEVLGLPKLQKNTDSPNNEICDSGVIEWINKSNKELRILCYPYHAVGVYKIMLLTDKEVLFPALSCLNDEKWMRDFERYDEGYPYVRLCFLDEMEAQYGINFLILDKKDMSKRGYINWVPPDHWEKLNIGGDVYDVYFSNLHE